MDQSKKGGNIRKRYNQVPNLTQDTTWESNKNTIYVTNKSQEVSLFPAGDHKAAMNRRKSMRYTRHKTNLLTYLYPPQTLFVVGILFSRCPCVRVCVRPSVTFCFFNILKSHCWIFIKPCKHVYICKTNTLDKKVRARGQFF